MSIITEHAKPLYERVAEYCLARGCNVSRRELREVFELSRNQMDSVQGALLKHPARFVLGDTPAGFVRVLEIRAKDDKRGLSRPLAEYVVAHGGVVTLEQVSELLELPRQEAGAVIDTVRRLKGFGCRALGGRRYRIWRDDSLNPDRGERVTLEDREEERAYRANAMLRTTWRRVCLG